MKNRFFCRSFIAFWMDVKHEGILHRSLPCCGFQVTIVWPRYRSRAIHVCVFLICHRCFKDFLGLNWHVSLWSHWRKHFLMDKITACAFILACLDIVLLFETRAADTKTREDVVPGFGRMCWPSAKKIFPSIHEAHLNITCLRTVHGEASLKAKARFFAHCLLVQWEELRPAVLVPWLLVVDQQINQQINFN